MSLLDILKRGKSRTPDPALEQVEAKAIRQALLEHPSFLLTFRYPGEDDQVERFLIGLSIHGPRYRNNGDVICFQQSRDGASFLALSEEAWNVLKEAEQTALGKRAEQVLVIMYESF